MNRLTLGIIGHVDHGKTALVRTLTGMETDRLPEEQARGISIALGFAHLRVGADEIDCIDMPGHERFVRTMVAGATGIDAVLLVVDAREGVMPQTREHVDIAALLGVRRAVIAISRVDLAEPAQIAASAHAAASLAAAAGLHAAPPVPCSTRTGHGMAALLDLLAAELAHAEPRLDEGAAWLPVDRAFSVAGHGTVVTGTLRGGGLAVGEPIDIVPGGAVARIRGLQVHGSRVSSAAPGQRVAVNLRGAEPSDVPRGTALAAPGSLTASAWLTVQLRAVADAPPIPTGSVLKLLFGTSEIQARLRLLDRDVLLPNAAALAQLHCAELVCVPGRARFVLRGGAILRTIAGGAVIDPDTSRARRHTPAILARLAALAEAPPAAIAAAVLNHAGSAGSSLTRIARLAGVGAPRAAALLGEGAVLVRSGAAISAAGFATLIATLPQALAAYPEGLARTRMVALLPQTAPALLDEAAARLVQAGTLASAGGILRVPRPQQEHDQARRLAAQAARIASALRDGGLTPPDAAAVAPDPATRRLLDQLVRAGIVVRAPDHVQKRDILFHRDAIAAARLRLAPLLTGQGLLVGEIGSALGMTRKFSVPLLEHLDSVGFTRRVAERRVLAASA